MLKELRIKNFALVEDGRFDLAAGMVSFTGETGAGKSLLLDAITLLLGSKSHADMVRTGCTSAEVEGVFDLSKDAEKRVWTAYQGFDVDPEEGSLLSIRREISSREAGKNRIWIQGKSATRAELQRLLSPWVEVSGQHEFLRLGKEDYLLSLVDHFGGLKTQAQTFEKLYREYSEAHAQLEAWKAKESEREQRLDYLKFQLEEFERAEIHEGIADEEISLISMRSKLGSVEKIRTALSIAKALVSNEEEGGFDLSSTLQKAVRELRTVAGIDPSLEQLGKEGEALSLGAEDFISSLDRNLSHLESDPESLERAEQRLSTLQRLKRKYAQDTPGLIEIFAQAKKQYEELQSADNTRSEFEKRFTEKLAQLQQQADKLFANRLEVAKRMSGLWEKDIRLLGMKHASLQIELKKDFDYLSGAYTRLETRFSANPGESPKSLAKIASGGELSRIMLALKNLVASQSEVSVYLFDEVDSGIGGETAQVVGERLKSISQQNQVLVVTHLPQIAAFSDQQFCVEKTVEKARTKTEVRELNSKGRLQELSRMLGATGSKSALKLAEELLQKAEKIQNKAPVKKTRWERVATA